MVCFERSRPVTTTGTLLLAARLNQKATRVDFISQLAIIPQSKEIMNIS